MVGYSNPFYFIIWTFLDVVLHIQSKQAVRNVLAQVLENKSQVRLVQLQGSLVLYLFE